MTATHTAAPAPATHSAGADDPACQNPQAEHRCSGNRTPWRCPPPRCYPRPARPPPPPAHTRPPPAAPVTSTSPLTRALLSVPGVAYLPFTAALLIASGTAAQLLPKIGARPILIAGSAASTGGLYWLSRISEHDTYASAALGPV